MSLDPSSLQHKSVRNRLKEALAEPAHLLSLAGIASVGLALLSPIPILVGLVAEAAYLLFVPDSNWYTKRLEKKFDQEILDHRAALKAKIYPKVKQEIQTRFEWLEAARRQIEATTPAQDPWFMEALRKLDFLLEKYIQFADRQSDYINYLGTSIATNAESMGRDQVKRLPGMLQRAIANPGESYMNVLGASLTDGEVDNMVEVLEGFYDREIGRVKDSMESEAIMATREIMSKRHDVLVRRRDFTVRLGEVLSNLRHQMDLIYETFGLINDEIRARSPEQVLADINDVVSQATTLTDAIDQFTPAEQLVAKLE